MSLAELARAPRPIAEVGGKAYNLARLIAAGARVPGGWVIGASSPEPADTAVFRGERFAVRSSSPSEDRADRVAPGVFASVVDVGRDRLAAAIAEVRASATGELAALYARVTGSEPNPAMAVIVQRYVEPDRAGTVYTRAPGRPSALVIEPRDGAPIEIDRTAEPPDAWADLVAACLEAEAALGLDDGADIEWVEAASEIWLVQARALPPAPALERPPPEVFDFARADPSITWRLDLAHNPEPLSPAQQGLVELVVDRCGARLALARGWLYEAAGEPGDSSSGAGGDLEALFFSDVEPAADARLSKLEAAPPDLEAALDAFAEIHARYGEVAAALSSARRRAGRRGRSGSARAQAIALAGDSRAAAFTRERAARLAALDPAAFYRPYATAWDVAAPAIEPPSPGEPGTSSGVWLADLCAAIAELDDRLFYRAQRLVRRALLARGIGDDVFWLPLDDVRANALADAPARAATARAEHDRARALWMPIQVRGDDAVDRGVGLDRRALHGRGFGGRATGRILKLPASAIPAGAIVAAIDLTPADALGARQAAGIALEAGSLLGHGAAMARELGIPIVVRIPGLCRIVADGERVVLAGDAGVLLREAG